MHKRSDTADRMEHIRPFYVMGLLARARELEAEGRDVIHMEVGEPDFTTPETIVRAGQQALADGYTRYLPATGLPELQKAIAGFYKDRYGVWIDHRRVIVTPGASGALQLALSVLIDPGDQVLMTDPGYPCNRNFVHLVGGEPVGIPVGPDSHYQLDAATVSANWSERTKAVLVASPSNPTGTLLGKADLSALHHEVCKLGGVLIVDEIYQGLVYGGDAGTALSVADDLFIINSFSKYFGMTGWRLGWMVVPDRFIAPVDRLAQNIFLSASSPAQYAALEAFSSETLDTTERRRQEFKVRRDYLLSALRSLGLKIAVEPEGAFYLYADCSALTEDSYSFAVDLLESEGVAITPGKDFGFNLPQQHLRFAYTTSVPRLKEGVDRLARFIRA
ncbi:MAG: pyridoxal phosphate-dependent aminotransferase [Gammaproteobacteria bacterium]|nr:pyridoxal phosphate-dependent aminotransferase [Gammaproteobacteria bacterium]